MGRAADLIDASIAADLGITVQALRARQAQRAAAYAPRAHEVERVLDDDYLAACTVCMCCRLFHPIDDDCPAPPRHCID